MSSTMLAAAIATVSAIGCATHERTTTTTYAASDVAAASMAGRTGTVDSVGEVVDRVKGNPVGGAAAGALISGVVFGSGAAAVGGALVGGALSSGRSEKRTYEVVVRFDDGERGVFTYAGTTPFRPGDRVALGPHGLIPED